MGVFESTRCSLDPREERILARMVRDRRRAQPPADEDVEISGAEPPEEAHAKRFDRGPSRALGAEVWGYPYSRNYASELYNFAWARAVQNKPLGIELVGPASPSEDEEEDEKLVQDVVVSAEDGAEVSGEKEEGELEEGEIEFGAEAGADGALSELEELEEEKGVGEEDEDGVEEMGQFDRLVSSILEELEAVTEEEVEKSFEEICTRLRKSFERLKQMVSETHVLPVINALVQQAFMGIQTAHTVVSSGSSKNVEQDKDLLLRLLIHIKNQYHILLTPEQSTEIDTMVKSLVFDNDTKDKETNGWIRGNANNSGNIAEKVERTRVDLRAFKAGLPKLELPANPRIKAEFSPLLDLHGAYDEGSLPSPTRENPPPLPMHRPSGVGMGSAFFTQPITPMNIEAEDTILHPSMMDPLKAVSSYQQKYGQTSLFGSNQLPSPTPSEESNDGNDNDLHGEVSSFSAAGNARPLNPQTSSPFDRFTSGGDFAPNWSAHQQPSLNILGQLGSSPNPVMKSTIKCRDPRLRFINSEVGGAPNSDRHLMSVASDAPKNGVLGETTNSRKHQALDKSVLDDHTSKKQRNDNMDSRNMQGALRRDGLLEDSNVATHQPSSMIRLNGNVQLDNRRPESGEIGFISSERRPDANTKCNASTVGVGQNPSGSTVGSVYSPFLLKDFNDIAAVNPTTLIQLLQKRLAAETKQKTADPMHFLSRNTLCETVPALNAAPTKSSEANQNQAGQPQMPAKPVTMNDGGKIRMKPRDPRRMLHNNMVQNSENGGFKQSKTDGTLSLDTQNNKDNIKTREQVEQAWTTGLPSQPTSVPDIAQQFTKNLADIIASTRLTNNSPGFTQNNAQPIPSKLDKADVTCPTAEELNKADMTRPTAEASNQKSATTSSCEVGTSGASQSPNAWGNVDHLLDGYDDQQKAAIQRERVRRIEEQNKMFAARKLCLVLDLDHTLLNSAKFAEVDPVHDEILRKKEELDRDKPPRHLFRFPHMGMWTKLRPGIWNFLEKASKLYELHVYTMGNKLYATEMAKVLDPTGALFAGRVISRGDDSDLFDGDDRVPKSKDLDGVLGMESAVVIIDDSVRVWPHNKLNLIVVERYTYFPCSRRQFGLLGPSLLEIDHDERPEDGTLASSLAVIERIHQNFFSHRSLKDVDVRNILAAEQRKILSGCKIVFSRVFPVGETNPQLHPLWQTAEQFGAVCTNQVDEQVTHVVANSLGTDKVNWALSTGRFVVHPGWVEASALLYRRANELDFVVKQ